MAHAATLHLAAGPSAAQAVAASLRVEAADAPPGTTLECVAGNDGLDLRLEAPDLASLRAALHSAVRLAEAGLRSAALA